MAGGKAVQVIPLSYRFAKARQRVVLWWLDMDTLDHLSIMASVFLVTTLVLVLSIVLGVFK